MLDYEPTFEQTLEHEKHRVFPSDMSKWTLVAIAHKDNVIKALEKQIPKKPIWEGDGYSYGDMVYDTWYCPSCDYDYEDTEEYKYCPCCGQAIDWSKE